jgi:hypothetical protein
VRLYTCGLPPDVRTARRAELESDVWEHLHDHDGRRQSAVALEIVRRTAAGVPADVAWRLEHRGARRLHTHARSRVMLANVKKHGMVALAGALALWLLFVAVMAPFVDDDWDATGAEKAALASLSALAGLLVVAGLIGRARGSRGWRYVLAAGALVAGVLNWWAIVPSVAALAILIWLFAPRHLRRAPTQPA